MVRLQHAAALLLGLLLCVAPGSQAQDVTGNYMAKLTPIPAAILSQGSGFVSIRTYANATADVTIVVYNVTDMTMAHIHVYTPSGSNPPGVWLLPLATSASEAAPLGTGPYADIPPLTGALIWAATINASNLLFPSDSGITSWAQFAQALNQGNALYVNVHSVEFPAGVIDGNITAGTFDISTMAPEPRDLPAPLPVPLSASDAETGVYVTMMEPVPGTNNNISSGYVRITTFINETAIAQVVCNKLSLVTQAHIHILENPTDTAGPIFMWLLPAAADAAGRTLLGTGIYNAIPPLYGSFSWSFKFNHSYFVNQSYGWPDFRSFMENTPSRLYAQVHTVEHPGGEIKGFLATPTLSSPPSLGSPPLLASPSLSSPSLSSPPLPVMAMSPPPAPATSGFPPPPSVAVAAPPPVPVVVDSPPPAPVTVASPPPPVPAGSPPLPIATSPAPLHGGIFAPPIYDYGAPELGDDETF